MKKLCCIEGIFVTHVKGQHSREMEMHAGGTV